MCPTYDNENGEKKLCIPQHLCVDKTECSSKLKDDTVSSELELRSKLSFLLDPSIVEKKNKVLKRIELKSRSPSDTKSSHLGTSSRDSSQTLDHSDSRGVSSCRTPPDNHYHKNYRKSPAARRKSPYTPQYYERTHYAVKSPSGSTMSLSSSYSHPCENRYFLNTRYISRSPPRNRHSSTSLNTKSKTLRYHERGCHNSRSHTLGSNTSSGMYVSKKRNYTHCKDRSPSTSSSYSSQCYDYHRSRYNSSEHSKRPHVVRSRAYTPSLKVRDRNYIRTQDSDSHSPGRGELSQHNNKNYRRNYYTDSRKTPRYHSPRVSKKDHYTRYNRKSDDSTYEVRKCNDPKASQKHRISAYKLKPQLGVHDIPKRRSSVVSKRYDNSRSGKTDITSVESTLRYNSPRKSVGHDSYRIQGTSLDSDYLDARRRSPITTGEYYSRRHKRKNDYRTRTPRRYRSSKTSMETYSIKSKSDTHSRYSLSQSYTGSPQELPTDGTHVSSAAYNSDSQQDDSPIEFCIYDSLNYFKDMKKIGEGAFGYVEVPHVFSSVNLPNRKVYKARLVHSNTLVALKKVVERKGERNRVYDNIFSVPNIRELMFLTQFRHKNILQLQGIVSFLSPNNFNQLVPVQYYLLEYMDYDLASLLQHGDLSYYELQHIKCMAKQFFCGLAFIHEQNYVHRDIKSGNVLLNTRGELKIADFGFACPIPEIYENEGTKPLTNRVCTIFYRPLELLLGAIEYSKEVDMWGAGCIFAEMFLRIPLFRTRSGSEIDQIALIRRICGPVSEKDWLSYSNMKNSWAGFFGFLKNSDEPRLLETYLRSRAKMVTKAAINLISQLLDYSPSRRLNAKSCLEHPFFTKEHPPASECSEIPIVEGEWHDFDRRQKRRFGMNHGN